LVGYNLLSLK